MLEKERDWEKEEASKAFKSLHLIQGVVFKDEAWKTQVEVEKTQSIQAQYDEISSKLISQVREEQKTEEEKLIELRAQFENILKNTKNAKDREVVEKINKWWY